MATLNDVKLIGNLVRDPEVKVTPGGTDYMNNTIAVNERRKIKDEYQDVTTFVDFTVWGSGAAYAGEYLKKGSLIFLDGSLKLDKWTDKESGEQRQKLAVNVNSLQGLGSRPKQQAEAADAEPDPF